MKLSLTQYALLGLNIAYRLYSGLFMIIADCDETFNYWEPLNLLLRGFGKETWEYSPEYKIRSYAYLLPYYLLGKVCQLFNLSPVTIFYCIRVFGIIGFTCYCEWKLFNSLRRYSPTLANWWLLFNTIAPGMSHAGVALLPSSLAMQTATLANSYLLRAIGDGRQLSQNISKAVFWYFIGGILGWPFALALGLPIGLYTVYHSVITRTVSFSIYFRIAGVMLLIVAAVVAIDTVFYRNIMFVPANIVLYNVFGGEGEGPEIFGVEPMSYYILNLALNFHVIFPLGIAGMVLNPIIAQGKEFALLISMQLVTWVGIFFVQPHKEERFLYPIYSLISLLAAMLVSKLTLGFKRFIPKRAYAVLQAVFIIGLITVSNLRIVNLVENYGAPLKTFSAVAKLEHTSPVNVCMGKEWYHFPASFFLPDSHRLRFVDCGFDGLLPADFYEEGSVFDSTTFIPPNMNNKNKFELDKVVALQECDYFVDNSQVNSIPQLIYPNLTTAPGWQLMECNKILNPEGQHSFIGKLLYIPYFKVEFMDFCLIRKEAAV
ncbi:Alpha-1,2-mannosyltransferase ALG9 [Candida viswanathii]|uniref:Mannosyltransferase n=1 Tax=Candida viswanathii TaxID=5486 RepID=A0A367YJ12_9ASCO|nr:Alpha-1,2-mannosyltransferase ALG9 [Candida viswanathii]